MDGVNDKKNMVNKYRKPGSSIKSSELQGELEQKILKADIEDIIHKFVVAETACGFYIVDKNELSKA